MGCTILRRQSSELAYSLPWMNELKQVMPEINILLQQNFVLFGRENLIVCELSNIMIEGSLINNQYIFLMHNLLH